LFIAVGALHLPEKHGLLIQLQQQGFTVNKML
ncbi:TraB/GumN family protein, partial [Pseudoalteromonas ruthenica]